MDENDLIHHYHFHHPDAAMIQREVKHFHKLSHICDICDATFDTIMEVDAHLASEHGDQYTCEQCDMKFTRTLAYAKHIYGCLQRIDCLLCSTQFSSRRDLRTHYPRHLKSMRPYVCDEPDCGRRFRNLCLLKYHMSRHVRERNYQCEHCAKFYKCMEALNSHVQRMHTEKPRRKQKKVPSICDVCGKTLSSVEKLKYHLRIHTGYKPFKCEHCDKTFTLKKLLVEHTRVHTGERPFPCEICGKRFTQRTPLVTHMRGHTGERPYACDICDNAFVSRSTLNTHLKKCRGITQTTTRKTRKTRKD